MIALAEYCAWVPMILFCAAPLAQIYLNWVKRSTKSISQWTIFLGLAGLLCSLLYDYFMWLPLAYRMMHPPILMVWATLALQEFWYSGRTFVRSSLMYAYALLFVAASAALFWGQYYPLQIGVATGWLFTFLYAVFQIPQIIKNQQERSVHGLSFWYVSMMGCASAADLGIAYWRLLPLPSVLNAVRGLLVYAIFVYQFACFSERKK